MRFISFIIILAVSFATDSASAWVDLKNANLAISRKDFEVEETGPDLVLERTYNSRVEHAGVFGRGWCSNVESTLTFVSKSVAVFQYCGVGRAKIFKSKAYDAAEDAKALETLIATVAEKMARDAKIPKDFSTFLRNDIELRALLVRNYGVSFPVADGDSFTISNFPEASEISVGKGRFIMREEDGDRFEFDSAGALTSISDRVGQSIKIVSEKGRLKSIVDSRNTRIVFKTDSAARVIEATGPGRNVKYKYSVGGDLVSVAGLPQNEEYAYDAGHNLVSFRIGKSAVTAKYDEKTDRVTELATKLCTKRYAYDVKSTARKMSVELDANCKGKPREKVKYEFAYRESKSGRLYQAEMTATDSNRNKTAVRYSDDNRPVWMERKGVVTEFGYDARGRLAKVMTKDGRAEYTYDGRGRLETFKSNVKRSGKLTKREIRYSYAEDGSLKTARDGSVVTTFEYDRQGRISKVANNRGKKVEVLHRSPASELPSGIKSSKDGKIDLTYGTTGALVPPRDDVALARFVSIMATFQELVEPGSEVLRKVSEP